MVEHTFEFDEKTFLLFKKYIYDKVGIELENHKKGLLRNRLNKRLKALNIKGFSEYYDFLRRSNDELSFFISAITTNITSFFREPKQWEFLKINLKRRFAEKGTKSIDIWSAGCATGEEPYTIAIFLRDLLGSEYKNYTISLLATDISEKALSKAKEGKYEGSSIHGLTQKQLSMYFSKSVNGSNSVYTVNEDIKKSIQFKIFNLIYGNFSSICPAKKFDIIFCRNVMIYFDSDVKRKLVERFIGSLAVGGYILVGHSESLMHFNNSLQSNSYGIYTKK